MQEEVLGEIVPVQELSLLVIHCRADKY